MPNDSHEYYSAKQLLERLIELNKAIAREQYRTLVLKTHNQKRIKLIDPKDPVFFYLN